MDTSKVTLETGTPSSAAPLGVVAVVKDASAAPSAGRQITWTVSRGGATLYSATSTTGADGRVSAPAGPQGIPEGVLTVKAGCAPCPVPP